MVILHGLAFKWHFLTTCLHSKTKVSSLTLLEIAGVEIHSANIHALADTRVFYQSNHSPLKFVFTRQIWGGSGGSSLTLRPTYCTLLAIKLQDTKPQGWFVCIVRRRLCLCTQKHIYSMAHNNTYKPSCWAFYTCMYVCMCVCLCVCVCIICACM